MSKGIVMSNIKEILRLHYELELKQHEIAEILGISSSSVNKYINHFTALGNPWPFSNEFIASQLRRSSGVSNIDFAVVHAELMRHKSMTLQLIWEEYHSEGKTELSYSYFAKRYKCWKRRQPQSMRQVHIGGDKVFIDYCGDTIGVVDSETSEIRKSHIFVGVLGASNYMYFDASWSQSTENWITSNVRMLDYFNGVPSLLVPDNLRSAVDCADRYEAEINRTYAEFARYYGTVVMPARPYKPKDKASAECGVLIVQRWVLMRLRNMTFTGLEQLNTELRRLMKFVNNRRFKKMPGTRQEMFEMLDQPALKPLPSLAYEFKQYKKARVGGDYHVELSHHYYSVPYQYVGWSVDIWYNAQIVEIHGNLECLAKHVRSMSRGNSTISAHMPVGHKKRAEWTEERCRTWANTIGMSTLHLVEKMLASAHSENAKRSCLGLMSLAKLYGSERLEAASSYALKVGAITRKQMISILKSNLDQVIISDTGSTTAESPNVIIHENIRGPEYYV